MALPVRRKSARARAGSEQKRNTSAGEDIRHREDGLTTQIYVENRDIDALLAFGQFEGSTEVASRSDHFATEIREHVL
jgi:hypothetical protein